MGSGISNSPLSHSAQDVFLGPSSDLEPVGDGESTLQELGVHKRCVLGYSPGRVQLLHLLPREVVFDSSS